MSKLSIVNVIGEVSTTVDVHVDNMVFNDEDGSYDLLKTLKAVIKVEGGKIGDFDFNEEGTRATSKDDESIYIEIHEVVSGGMAATLAQHALSYEKATSYSGGATKINGDNVSYILAPLSPSEVMTIAEQLLELESGFLSEKYKDLNAGAQRMNSGNRIRGGVTKGKITEYYLARAVEFALNNREVLAEESE